MLKIIPYLFISVLILGACSREGCSDQSSPQTTDTTKNCVQISRVISGNLSDSALLDLVQGQTIKYFWDFAEPTSGMARERNSSGTTVTTGGTGFGIMAIIAGVNRGFVGRDTAVGRLLHLCNFLKKADRYHGAWSHWMDGYTGHTIPFSTKDNGGDLVETGFLVQGLIAARQYFNLQNQKEDSLRRIVDSLWYAVDWKWYQNGQNKLFWHWSPNYNFEMNHPIQGWNEALIVYVLAASSPTHTITKEVYENGWADNGSIKNGKLYFGQILPLGTAYGGPLFFEHYSFLGLDPRKLEDQYANYWKQVVSHSLINLNYCVSNPYKYCYYADSCWGLTASDDPEVGYQAHAPYNNWGADNGTITPTAALSSFPYTPVESMKALRFFYYYLGNHLWGTYGFKDAFNLQKNWYADSYLAIDEGPIAVMIENYRSGLLWNVFMKNTDIQNGLSKLGFNTNNSLTK